MPLTHDIGVRIPYPLLKQTTSVVCFFLFVCDDADHTTMSYVRFVTLALASELARHRPQSTTFGLFCIISTQPLMVLDSALLTEVGLRG